MEWIGGFLLGFAGSLHCAGMCGPLLLALRGKGLAEGRGPLGPAAHHLGRLLTYGAIGALFATAGQTLAFAGFQRWVSILAGVLVLAGLAGHALSPASRWIQRATTSLRSRFGALLGRRTLGAAMGLGALNGLLPCGLVYVAAAGAAATANIAQGVAFMLAFGMGTLPMLLGITWVGAAFPAPARLRWRKAAPFAAACAAALLILRGMALGIPYLSPALGAAAGAACH